ncbi:hypothetical protein E2C01_063060 [Portunus trituberculatus]|uniref:Uncharacterized protein n=1 Tax=Portunus trituberculatus TaxID=210409 RepID=A0A5B7H9H9_PORTR|nr:hypothetical protein [Portunus trituberculatus]
MRRRCSRLRPLALFRYETAGLSLSSPSSATRPHLPSSSIKVPSPASKEPPSSSPFVILSLLSSLLLASPHLALPRLTSPRLASPRLASPRI